MYRPKDSDLMNGGLRKFRARRSVIRGQILPGGIRDVHLTDVTRIKREVPDYDEALEDLYSPRELVLLAEKMLLCDPRPFHEGPYWLNSAQLRMRGQREIYVASGTPDSAFVSGLYWRTHPEGRGVHSDAQRGHNGASYYRDGRSYVWEEEEALRH